MKLSGSSCSKTKSQSPHLRWHFRILSGLKLYTKWMYSSGFPADFLPLRSSGGRKKGDQFFSVSARALSRIVRMVKYPEKGRNMYIARFQSERSSIMLKI